jgi:hypothetical protein
MKWPWISREQYDAVLSAKEEIVQSLKDQNAILSARLSAPIAVSVSLPEGFAIQQAAIVGRRPRRQDEDSVHPVPILKEIDWANVDENDNESVARIAAQELGAPVPPHVLARTVAQIKFNIRSARADKIRNALKEGKVGTMSRHVEARTEEEAIAQGSNYIPKEIIQLVENAERG